MSIRLIDAITRYWKSISCMQLDDDTKLELNMRLSGIVRDISSFDGYFSGVVASTACGVAHTPKLAELDICAYMPIMHQEVMNHEQLYLYPLEACEFSRIVINVAQLHMVVTQAIRNYVKSGGYLDSKCKVMIGMPEMLRMISSVSSDGSPPAFRFEFKFPQSDVSVIYNPDITGVTVI